MGYTSCDSYSTKEPICNLFLLESRFNRTPLKIIGYRCREIVRG